MSTVEREIAELLARAKKNDADAVNQLLERHRAPLKRMVQARMDRRMATRMDASDVVQESLALAASKLPGYLRDEPIPFLAWLRRLAWERLIQLHRRHVDAQRRTVTREQHLAPSPDQSSVTLAALLASEHTAPPDAVVRQELLSRLTEALAQLSDLDREVLVLRYLEQMPTKEIASLLSISPGAVSMRHLRAIERLRSVLGGDLVEDPT